MLRKSVAWLVRGEALAQSPAIAGLAVPWRTSHDGLRAEQNNRSMVKTRQPMVSISGCVERLDHVKSKKRWAPFLPQAKRSDSDASHDLSDSHREERVFNPFTCVEHCALDSASAPGGGVPGARLDDGVTTTRTACADECAAGRRVAPVHWRC